MLRTMAEAPVLAHGRAGSAETSASSVEPLAERARAPLEEVSPLRSFVRRSAFDVGCSKFVFSSGGRIRASASPRGDAGLERGKALARVPGEFENLNA